MWIFLGDVVCAYFKKCYHWRPLEFLGNYQLRCCIYYARYKRVLPFVAKCRKTVWKVTDFSFNNYLVWCPNQKPCFKMLFRSIILSGRSGDMYVYRQEMSCIIRKIQVQVLIECFLFKASWWAWSFQLAACVLRREWETGRVVIVVGRKATGPKNAL